MFKILVISYIGRTQNSDTTTKGLFKVIIIIQKFILIIVDGNILVVLTARYPGV